MCLSKNESGLLDSAQNVERNVAHQIPAQIARYRTDNEDERNKHSHAEDIADAIRHAVFGHENALQNLVENNGHTEAARRTEQQPRQQCPDQIPNFGFYVCNITRITLHNNIPEYNLKYFMFQMLYNFRIHLRDPHFLC